MTVKETDIRGHDDLIHRLTKATAIAVNVEEQDLDLDPPSQNQMKENQEEIMQQVFRDLGTDAYSLK